MWTAKRILLLVVGAVIFITAYAIYAYFLGVVDGLPPLPAQLLKQHDAIDRVVVTRTTNTVDQKLQQAFGPDCDETRYTMKMEVRSRGMVLAFNEFRIEEKGPREGQVRLIPFSVAIFGKQKGDNGFPEINTIQSDVAYLTFDQPIKTASDMSSHKIIGGELVRSTDTDGEHPRRSPESRVRIVNNRRTPQRDDDLILSTPGPVFYQENLHQIWTREAVELLDEQTKPSPTKITAIGMDVYLSTEETAPAPNAPPKAHAQATPGHRPKGNGITGVKSVMLRSDVNMNLWVDGSSGFMGNTKKSTPASAREVQGPPNPDAKPSTAGKAQVVIQTQGPFFYDALTDHARFDVSQHPGPSPDSVHVTRQRDPSAGLLDQLFCDHLELQFVRKSAEEATSKTQSKPAPASSEGPAGERGVELQIQTAHAWGKEVTITSDAECLEAHGNDLVYDARTRETTLQGNQDMWAIKEGNEIVCRWLVMIGGEQGEGKNQNGGEARAKGPGVIRLLDKASGQRNITAVFKESLCYAKDGQYDQLTLIGDASFQDAEHGQKLMADQLKVWLEPGAAAKVSEKAAAANDAASEAQRRRPHHLEAIGHVVTDSEEMHIHDTDRLMVWFKDVPLEELPTAPKKDAPAPLAPGGEPAVESVPASAPAAAPTTTVADKPATPALAAKPAIEELAGPPKPPAPKEPIDLRARSVEAHVLRCETKNDLERLWCEGEVHVFQRPTTPDEKGTDITGDTLQLLHFVEGYVMKVCGNLAEVQLDKMTIIGPEVNIDQKENKAWVVGLGAMRMPSDSNMDGSRDPNGVKKDKPASEMVVHWNRDMFFNGNYAEFHGGIQAEQDNGRLTCQTMVVHLDRRVSLKPESKPKPKPGEKPEPPAKVQKVLCDKSVRIDDCKYDEDGKLVGRQRIESPELSVDNEENLMVAPGPGLVRLFQVGAKGEVGPSMPASRPAPGARTSAPTQPAQEETKLTRIQYLGRMFANNNTRTAIFYDSVEVVHVPTQNPDLPIDLDKLPTGAMYLRCDKLKVYNHKETTDKKANQEMQAEGHAVVQSQEFWGRADTIKFDEAKDCLVFEAAPGNTATLYKITTPGAQPQEIKAGKITYWRKTGGFNIEHGLGISGQQ